MARALRQAAPVQWVGLVGVFCATLVLGAADAPAPPPPTPTAPAPPTAPNGSGPTNADGGDEPKGSGDPSDIPTLPVTIQLGPDGLPVIPEKYLSVIDPRFVTAQKTLDLQAVVKYFENLYRADSSIAEAKLTVIRPDSARTLSMKIWSRGENKALVVITDPPREKNTATLKVDRNLWNYLPRIKRTIRIPPAMMLQAWMGSDFTNDDLVRESSYSKDYTYTLVGATAKPPGWLVRFTAKPGVVGLWQRFDVVLSPDGTLPIASRWYDRRGRLARELNWDEVKMLGGKKLPARMTLIPTDEPGQKTILEYSSIQFNAAVDDAMFSLSRLEEQR
ncbi:MAG: outer membrane lipoprotein-sorting protein [Planctomycetota bacterium]